MPKMGDAMTEGKVVRWYKKPGDAIKKGEPVLEIETDKVNLDLEAEDDGILSELSAQEGQVVPVGGVLATIGAQGAAAKPAEKSADPSGSANETSGAKKEKAVSASEPEPEPEPKPEPVKKSKKEESNVDPPAKDLAAAGKTPTRPAGPDSSRTVDEGSRVKSSPLARKIAQQMGVELTAVRGSGPSGRVIAADVQGAVQSDQPRQKQQQGTSHPATPSSARSTLPPLAEMATTEIPLTAMRRTIAKRLAESTGPIPHFFLTIDVDVTDLSALRTQLNEIEGSKVSINDFVIRAAALALRHHPDVNASFGSEAITRHGEIHVGVAVATPEGLITPVIRNANEKSLTEIASNVRSLADKAKNRKIRPEEYQGATFTISNLGMFGIEEFTAIINPPNSAILAVGAAVASPVVVDRAVVIRDRMKITMSCDHRVIDGAAGAKYLSTLRTYLEQPLRLFV